MQYIKETIKPLSVLPKKKIPELESLYKFLHFFIITLHFYCKSSILTCYNYVMHKFNQLAA